MDPWFIRTVPAGMQWSVLAAGDIERLGERLESERAG